MNITLKLWHDQSGADSEDINSLAWVLHVNGEVWPGGGGELADYTTIHKAVNLLLDAEELMCEYGSAKDGGE